MRRIDAIAACDDIARYTWPADWCSVAVDLDGTRRKSRDTTTFHGETP
jgi:hypothetical protein